VADTFAILALRRKCAHLAGLIAAAQKVLSRQRQTLATLDAVIRLFESASNPELIAPIRPCAGRWALGAAYISAEASYRACVCPRCGRRESPSQRGPLLNTPWPQRGWMWTRAFAPGSRRTCAKPWRGWG
jgi:hypothetical protein